MVIDGGSVTGNTSIKNGAGENDTTIDAWTTAKLSVSGSSGIDDVTITNIAVTGKTSIRTGAAADSVTIAESVFDEAFRLTTGGGADVVDLTGAAVTTTFNGNVNISLGSDNDTLNLTDDANSVVEFAGTKNKVNGGKGVDALNIGPGTRTGTLETNQFELT